MALYYWRWNEKFEREAAERRRAEEELRRQKDLYEGMLKAQSELGEGFVVLEDQRIRYANEAFCKISGYDLVELRSLSSFMDGLFTASGQPAISPSDTLTYTPAPDAFGTATMSVRIEDDGGTADGGNDDSLVQTFIIAVSAVNDAPTVTLLNGPSAVREGDTATYTYTVADPGRFTFGNGYPDCGTGGELVGKPAIGGGSFKCRFVQAPAKPTVVVRVKDLDGSFSNVASKKISVAT